MSFWKKSGPSIVEEMLRAELKAHVDRIDKLSAKLVQFRALADIGRDHPLSAGYPDSVVLNHLETRVKTDGDALRGTIAAKELILGDQASTIEKYRDLAIRCGIVGNGPWSNQDIIELMESRLKAGNEAITRQTVDKAVQDAAKLKASPLLSQSRLAYDDLPGHLLEVGDYKHLCLPVDCDPPGDCIKTDPHTITTPAAGKNLLTWIFGHDVGEILFMPANHVRKILGQIDSDGLHQTVVEFFDELSDEWSFKSPERAVDIAVRVNSTLLGDPDFILNADDVLNTDEDEAEA